MEKIYRSKNGVVIVTVPETCDREELKKVTKKFLKKVLSGGKKYGNSDSSRDFREE